MPGGIVAEITAIRIEKREVSDLVIVMRIQELEPRRTRRISGSGFPLCTFVPFVVQALPASRHYSVFGSGLRDRAAKRSDQRMRPVACITTKSVMMAMIVIARPVKPRQKNA